MSAIVCGKRSFFEELPSPPVSSKRIRCSSSTSPIRFSPPRPTAATSPTIYNNFASVPEQSGSSSAAAPAHNLNHLRAVFPDMDDQLLERALEECGNDLDYAIRSLTELRLGSTDRELSAAVDGSPPNIDSQIPTPAGVMINDGDVAPSEDPLGLNNLQMDGSKWVELFVNEMMTASDVEDARARASRVLEVLEKNIHARAGAEAAQSFQKENMMLKEQVVVLLRENAILKRAVTIQHERQKEYEDKAQELQHLKKLVSDYQEQLRTLEVKNFTLAMHLSQTQQSSSMPGRFHPDVF